MNQHGSAAPAGFVGRALGNDRQSSSVPRQPPNVPDHTVLSCIGQGSYGEVWLARNVLGEFRAVKVIYRRAFEDDRPFEREFKGIRQFEPVSRSHPSQLNVLHVGHNAPAGYFYYVMELADDAAEPGEPDRDSRLATSIVPGCARRLDPSSMEKADRYVPHTLKLELDRRGRLPPEQCLKIGLALTTALEHLHEHGLVHRDIKPSNIIFVHGTPKLADIGLVAAMDATRSFVGTSGFLPPEGPGTPAADLYSLGKVLYEMAMGRDRQEFPKLAADLSQLDAPALLLELNAVIVKACHYDPHQRYRCAKELAADLLLVQGGHSVRRLRVTERRLALVTKVSAAVSAMLLAAAGLYWNATRQEQATARQLYAADMNLALQAWEGGNVSLARELLASHRERQPGILGFEWRLLARLCQQSDARFTLHGHSKTVWAVAFSPDGRTLATGSGDRTIQLWDTGSGRLMKTLTGHKSYIHALAFSPDGSALASGSRDFTVHLWNPRTGDHLTTLAGHTNALRSVVFSPDGRFLATAGEDKTIRWWDLATKREIARVSAGFTVEQLAFSPEGRVLAAAGAGSKVHFWDCATHQEQPPLALHQAQVLSVAYSSTGRMLASASHDGTIRLSDTASRLELAVLGRGAPVRCVAFGPGDKFLAAATEDGLVRLWDVARREVLITLRGHTANVRALAFSPTGAYLATGDEDAVARLWDVADPGRETALQHAGMVNGVAFSPDGKIVATTDHVGDTLRLWDVESQQAVASVRAATNSIWTVAFSPDGRAVVTGGVEGTVCLWNRADLSRLAVLKGHKGGVDAVAFSPDGRWIASASRDQTARIWDRASGRAVATFTATGSVVRTVAFSPDSRILAAAGTDGKIRLLESPSLRGDALLPAHQGEVRAVAFSPDGGKLVSGGADRTIRVWDVRRKKTLGTLAGHTAMISSLAFSPDAKTLASGSWDSTVKLWNLRLFREVGAVRAHSSQVTQVAFAPDGNTLASSSGDGTVRLARAVPADSLKR